MTAREDQSQAFVADRLVIRVEHAVTCFRRLARLVATQFRVLLGSHPLAPPGVDHLAFGGCGYPGRWIGRDAVARPALECEREGVLDRLFGEVEIAKGLDQRGSDAAVLEPKDALDRLMYIVRFGHGRSPAGQRWLGLPDRADLARTAVDQVRHLARPVHCLVEVPGVDEIEAAKLLFGLGERAVGNQPLAV